MKVLLVTDRPVIGTGVALLLEESLPEVELVQVSDRASYRGRLRAWTPDLAVIDLGFPRTEYRRMCRELHDAAVLTVCFVQDADDALRLLQSQADGVVSTRDGVRGLVLATRTVLAGNTFVPPALLGGVLHGLIHEQRHQQLETRAVAKLSSREREVLDLLGMGREVSEIAAELVISPETAKTHIRHVLSKLGAHSRVEAAALAAEAGLLQGRHL